MNEAVVSGQLPFQEISDEEFGDRLFYRPRAGIDVFTERAQLGNRLLPSPQPDSANIASIGPPRPSEPKAAAMPHNGVASVLVRFSTFRPVFGLGFAISGRQIFELKAPR
jgi:hypothetical protein